MIRLPIDDPIHRLDSRWLGWGGPFRYVEGVLFVGILLGALFIRAQLGIPVTPETAAVALAAVFGLTKLATSRINHDRKLRAVILTLRDEVDGPRPSPAVVNHTSITYRKKRRQWHAG